MALWNSWRRATKKPVERVPARVLWQGPFFVHHSLAHVNRELALALLSEPAFRESFHLELEHIGAQADGRLRLLRDCIQAPSSRPDVTIRHSWPPDLSMPGAGKLVVILPWEYGSIPRLWKTAIQQLVDEVWAPSTFVRDCYVRDGVPEAKVFVVPNGVNIERFRPGIRPYDLSDRVRGDPFVFLFVGGALWRKGTDVLLDAYARAFSMQDDVVLVIKDFGVGKFYGDDGYGARIREMQGNAAGPSIVYLSAEPTDDEVASLYARSHCLVHPYRGEGYGLPIAEAMACGKPAIVTGFGAALDFVHAENGYLLPYTVAKRDQKRVGELETVNFPYVAQPDTEALAQIMRRIVDCRAEVAAKGLIAARHIAEHHTWSRAAKTALERLQVLTASSAPA